MRREFMVWTLLEAGFKDPEGTAARAIEDWNGGMWHAYQRVKLFIDLQKCPEIEDGEAYFYREQASVMCQR